VSRIVEEWKVINRDLRRVCQALVEKLLGRGEKDPFIAIAGAFLHKATETLSGVNVLYANRLEEPAQALVRVLFELRINFDCFLKMAHDDLPGVCARVRDSMMLEKVKQARASGFGGIPDELRAAIEKDERDIEARYSPGEFARLRKHGFTGVPIEQRAALTGHEVAYSVVYRNFSRNVHSTDYVESYIKAGIYKGDDDPKYYESRDVVAHYTAHFSAAGMAEFANHVFKLGFDRELLKLGQRQQAIKKRDIEGHA
jgi:hypothetical protein